MSTNSKPPLISVVIPAYNSSATLALNVYSIMNQTYKNLDIIIVNDGSTDTTKVLAEVLAKNDSRISIINQKNQGLSGARNSALKAARGDYITFVDADDTISPDCLELLYNALKSAEKSSPDNPPKISICSFTEIYPEDGSLTEFKKPFTTLESYRPFPETLRPIKFWGRESTPLFIFDTPTALTNMLLENGFTMSAWGKLYARELFDDVEFPAGRLYEDVGTTYRLLLKSPSVAFAPIPAYNYYQLPTSIIHTGFNEHKLDLITLTDTMCADLDYYVESATNDFPAITLKNLSFAIAKRRLHARFSILRQLSTTKNTSDKNSPENQLQPNHETPKSQSKNDYKSQENQPSESSLAESLRAYILENKSAITDNPLASSRDRLALRTLELGLPAFNLAWKTYSKKQRR